MQIDFSQQIKELERILGRDSAEAIGPYRQHVIDDYKQGGVWNREDLTAMVNENVFNRVFIRKDSPNYLTKGDHQLVLRLNEGWVAKAANYFEFEKFYGTNPSPHYIPHSIDTLHFLNNEFGFDISMETVGFEYEEEQLKIKIDPEGFSSFMIVPDLTEGGKYIVRDIKQDEDFTQFSNVNELRDNLNNYLTRLVQLYEQFRQGKVRGWNAELHGHIEKNGTPKEAIRRMFFLKIDPNTKHGQIVPGDFNHVFFYRKERDKKR